MTLAHDDGSVVSPKNENNVSCTHDDKISHRLMANVALKRTDHSSTAKKDIHLSNKRLWYRRNNKIDSDHKYSNHSLIGTDKFDMAEAVSISNQAYDTINTGCPSYRTIIESSKRRSPEDRRHPYDMSNISQPSSGILKTISILESAITVARRKRLPWRSRNEL